MSSAFHEKPSDDLLFAVQGLKSDPRFQLLVTALRKEDADLSEESVILSETTKIFRNQGERLNLKKILELVDTCDKWILDRKKLKRAF